MRATEFLELNNPREMKLRRLLIYSTVLTFLLFLLLLLSLTLGSREQKLEIEAETLGKILNGDLSEIEKVIIFEIRLPRVLTAIFVGGGLALAGAILQAIIRNPLAEPYILGISSGSAFGAVLSIAIAGNFLFIGTPLASFAGASTVTGLVYLLGRKKGYLDINTMLLSGIMVGAFFSALILLTITLSGETVKNFIFWMLGNLSNVGLKQSLLISFVAVLTLILAFIYSHRLNLISTGEDIAQQLGVNVEATKRNAYTIASLLTGVIVSFTGIIGFIGLVVPHICRRIFSVDYRILIPTSFLMGGIILLVSDTIARVVFYPNELPVGAITAIFGAPFFIYLLRK